MDESWNTNETIFIKFSLCASGFFRLSWIPLPFPFPPYYTWRFQNDMFQVWNANRENKTMKILWNGNFKRKEIRHTPYIYTTSHQLTFPSMKIRKIATIRIHQKFICLTTGRSHFMPETKWNWTQTIDCHSQWMACDL